MNRPPQSRQQRRHRPPRRNRQQHRRAVAVGSRRKEGGGFGPRFFDMQKTCLTCLSLFAPNRPWQTFCQVKCRHNAPLKKVRTQKFQQSRRELISKIKMEKGCSRCGYNAHSAALDFNHIQGEKLLAIGQDTKVAWHKLMEEINKCEVLCANCHRIHTYRNRHWRTKRKVQVDV